MDYIVNDTELTATADSIREKTGDTALLEWVTGKGFADVISGIESGGVKFTKGTFTPTEEITIGKTGEYTIEHGLGEHPTFFGLIAETTSKYANSLRTYNVRRLSDSGSDSGLTGVQTSSSGSSSGYISSLSGVDIMNETAVYIKGYNANTILQPAKYYWIAVSDGGTLA